MIEIPLPGRSKNLTIQHLLLDMNGTLTADGVLIPDVKALLDTLSRQVIIHVLTADTFGSATSLCQNLPVTLTVIGTGNQALQKWTYLQQTGPEISAAIGNGMNDYMMLGDAALGIAVIGQEGGAVAAVTAADILTCSIREALELLCHPSRITATLRNS